jgi:hypothetical protein
MIVKCIANRVDQILPIPLGSGLSETTSMEYLTLGRTYRVYAMMLRAESLMVLINDDGVADWNLLAFFDVVDPRVPDDWEFRAFSPDKRGEYPERNLRAMWGYHEIVRSTAHYRGVIEWDPEAYRVWDAEIARREGASDASESVLNRTASSEVPPGVAAGAPAPVRRNARGLLRWLSGRRTR